MPAKRRAATIIRHPLFKRAVAFAAARQDEGATLMASWWRDYAASDDEARDKMIANPIPPPSGALVRRIKTRLTWISYTIIHCGNRRTLCRR